MLYENDVVQSVASYLEAKGYKIDSTCYDYTPGYDLVASKDMLKLYIEAKGETSQDPSTKRYGMPFTSTQVLDHVAKALFKCCQIISENEHEKGETIVGLALPDNRAHRNNICKIRKVLKKLDIMIFWVQEDKSVLVEVN